LAEKQQNPKHQPQDEKPRPHPTRDEHRDSVHKKDSVNESVPGRVQPMEQWSQPEKKQK